MTIKTWLSRRVAPATFAATTAVAATGCGPTYTPGAPMSLVDVEGHIADVGLRKNVTDAMTACIAPVKVMQHTRPEATIRFLDTDVKPEVVSGIVNHDNALRRAEGDFSILRCDADKLHGLYDARKNDKGLSKDVKGQLFTEWHRFDDAAKQAQADIDSEQAALVTTAKEFLNYADKGALEINTQIDKLNKAVKPFSDTKKAVDQAMTAVTDAMFTINGGRTDMPYDDAVNADYTTARSNIGVVTGMLSVLNPNLQEAGVGSISDGAGAITTPRVDWTQWDSRFNSHAQRTTPSDRSIELQDLWATLDSTKKQLVEVQNSVDKQVHNLKNSIVDRTGALSAAILSNSKTTQDAGKEHYR